MASVKDTSGSDEIYLVVQTRSIFACFLHWITVFSVIALAITGYYIGNPTYYYGQGEAYQAFAMANMREIHFIASSFLVVSVFTRMYLAFTRSCNKDIREFIPTPWNVINALKLAKYYATGHGEHAHYRFVNPLGGIGIFLMSVLIFIHIATGVLLYLPGAHPDSIFWSIGFSINYALGGQPNVRLIHYFMTYLLGSIVFIHIYFQVWKNIIFTESDISSIIGGYKIFPYSQLDNFADHYGLYLEPHIPTRKEMDTVSTPMKDHGG